MAVISGLAASVQPLYARVMDDGSQTVLERAFALARSGQFDKASDIKRKLAAEGFDLQQFTGRMLNGQLKDAMSKARKPRSPTEP